MYWRRRCTVCKHPRHHHMHRHMTLLHCTVKLLCAVCVHEAISNNNCGRQIVQQPWLNTPPIVLMGYHGCAIALITSTFGAMFSIVGNDIILDCFFIFHTCQHSNHLPRLKKIPWCPKNDSKALPIAPHCCCTTICHGLQMSWRLLEPLTMKLEVELTGDTNATGICGGVLALRAHCALLLD